MLAQWLALSLGFDSKLEPIFLCGVCMLSPWLRGWELWFPPPLKHIMCLVYSLVSGTLNQETGIHLEMGPRCRMVAAYCSSGIG